MSFIAVPRIRLSFFRAWLRQQGLNPDQYHPDDEPCERLRPNKVVRAASNAMAKTSGDEKEFPNPLTLEREKRSLTLEHMADLMGLKPASLLRDYERGVRLPTLGPKTLPLSENDQPGIPGCKLLQNK